MVGASFSGTDTYIQAYNHKTQEPYLTFKFNLPFDLSFSPRISYRHEEYSGPATGLEINNREDEQVRVGANLAWDISDSLTFDIDYQHINNKSNSELYVYKQDVVRSGLTFKF